MPASRTLSASDSRVCQLGFTARIFTCGLRQGSLGQAITPDKAALTAGFEALVSPRRGDVLAVHQQFDLRLFDPLALGIRNDPGHRQIVTRLRLSGRSQSRDRQRLSGTLLSEL